MEQKGAPPAVPPPPQGQGQRVPNPAGLTPPPTKTKPKTKKKKAGPGQIILQRETDKYVEAAGADDLGTGVPPWLPTPSWVGFDSGCI